MSDLFLLFNQLFADRVHLQDNRFGQYPVSNVWMKTTRFHQTHWRVQQVSKVGLQSAKFEEVAARGQIQQNINVAFWSTFIARNRTEQANVAGTMNRCQS